MTDHVLPEMNETPAPVTPPTFDELMADLKIARQDEADSKTARDKRLEELKKDDVYTFQAGKYETSSKLVVELQNKIKTMAKYSYTQSGNKDFHKGILPKNFSEFKVTDPHELRKWVFNNFPLALEFHPEWIDRIRALVIKSMPAALRVNESKVEDYVKNNKPVPGTEMGTRVEFQIASKL